MDPAPSPAILCLGDIALADAAGLLARHGLAQEAVADHAPIPGRALSASIVAATSAPACSLIWPLDTACARA